MQYLILAIYWYSTKPIYLSMIPYAVFSFFHAITYLRQSVIPTFVPSVVPPPGSNIEPPPGIFLGISRGISRWVKANYDWAMGFVSTVEVVGIMGWLIVNAITFRISLLTPLVFSQFLRLRYGFP